MTVSELIEALQKMPQDARVMSLDDSYYMRYADVNAVKQENVDWDDANDEPIVEVYIL
jgi:acetone carboxylase gamma subunit